MMAWSSRLKKLFRIGADPARAPWPPGVAVRCVIVNREPLLQVKPGTLLCETLFQRFWSELVVRHSRYDLW